MTTRTVHLSLPLNRPATGAPVITGPATVGQELAVDVTGIEDEDGLHDIEYTYQWVRVDADGTSNEEDITDADDTYTLTDDDLGKKVKIEVSFLTTSAATSNAPARRRRRWRWRARTRQDRGEFLRRLHGSTAHGERDG